MSGRWVPPGHGIEEGGPDAPPDWEPSMLVRMRQSQAEEIRRELAARPILATWERELLEALSNALGEEVPSA